MTDTVREPIRCDVCLRHLHDDEEWHTPHEIDCPLVVLCDCGGIDGHADSCPGPTTCNCAATTCPQCCWDCGLTATEEIDRWRWHLAARIRRCCALEDPAYISDIYQALTEIGATPAPEDAQR